MIRRLALTVSDVCLKLDLQSSTYSDCALEVSHFMRYINSRLTYLLTSLCQLVTLISSRRVNDPVIVIGIRFLNYALNFVYVISDSNILFSHRSFIFDVS